MTVSRANLSVFAFLILIVANAFAGTFYDDFNDTTKVSGSIQYAMHNTVTTMGDSGWQLTPYYEWFEFEAMTKKNCSVFDTAGASPGDALNSSEGSAVESVSSAASLTYSTKIIPFYFAMSHPYIVFRYKYDSSNSAKVTFTSFQNVNTGGSEAPFFAYQPTNNSYSRFYYSIAYPIETTPPYLNYNLVRKSYNPGDQFNITFDFDTNDDIWMDGFYIFNGPDPSKFPIVRLHSAPPYPDDAIKRFSDVSEVACDSPLTSACTAFFSDEGHVYWDGYDEANAGIITSDSFPNASQSALGIAQWDTIYVKYRQEWKGDTIKIEFLNGTNDALIDSWIITTQGNATRSSDTIISINAISAQTYPYGKLQLKMWSRNQTAPHSLLYGDTLVYQPNGDSGTYRPCDFRDPNSPMLLAWGVTWKGPGVLTVRNADTQISDTYVDDGDTNKVVQMLNFRANEIENIRVTSLKLTFRGKASGRSAITRISLWFDVNTNGKLDASDVEWDSKPWFPSVDTVTCNGTVINPYFTVNANGDSFVLVVLSYGNSTDSNCVAGDTYAIAVVDTYAIGCTGALSGAIVTKLDTGAFPLRSAIHTARSATLWVDTGPKYDTGCVIDKNIDTEVLRLRFWATKQEDVIISQIKLTFRGTQNAPPNSVIANVQCWIDTGNSPGIVVPGSDFPADTAFNYVLGDNTVLIDNLQNVRIKSNRQTSGESIPILINVEFGNIIAGDTYSFNFINPSINVVAVGVNSGKLWDSVGYQNASSAIGASYCYGSSVYGDSFLGGSGYLYINEASSNDVLIPSRNGITTYINDYDTKIPMLLMKLKAGAQEQFNVTYIGLRFRGTSATGYQRISSLELWVDNGNGIVDSFGDTLVDTVFFTTSADTIMFRLKSISAGSDTLLLVVANFGNVVAGDTYAIQMPSSDSVVAIGMDSNDTTKVSADPGGIALPASGNSMRAKVGYVTIDTGPNTSPASTVDDNSETDLLQLRLTSSREEGANISEICLKFTGNDPPSSTNIGSIRLIIDKNNDGDSNAGDVSLDTGAFYTANADSYISFKMSATKSCTVSADSYVNLLVYARFGNIKSGYTYGFDFVQSDNNCTVLMKGLESDTQFIKYATANYPATYYGGTSTANRVKSARKGSIIVDTGYFTYSDTKTFDTEPVWANNSNVEVLQFKIYARPQESMNINEINIKWKGNPAGQYIALQSVNLYVDSGADARYNGDTACTSSTAGYIYLDKIKFTGSPNIWTVNANETTTFLVTFSFNASLTQDATYAGYISADSVSLVVSGVSSGSYDTYPYFVKGNVWIDTKVGRSTGTLTIGNGENNPSAKYLYDMTDSEVVLQMKFSANSQENIQVSAINLSFFPTGMPLPATNPNYYGFTSGSPIAVSNIRLWMDSDASGNLTSGDTLLTTGDTYVNLSSGRYWVTLDNFSTGVIVPKSGNLYMLVSYDFGILDKYAFPKTYGAFVNSSADITALTLSSQTSPVKSWAGISSSNHIGNYKERNLTVVWGNNKSSTAGSILNTTFRVYVTDGGNRPVRYAVVKYEDTSYPYLNSASQLYPNNISLSIPPATNNNDTWIEYVETNASGYAEVTLKLDTKAGVNYVRASIVEGSTKVVFLATGYASVVNAVLLYSGNNQTGPANISLSNPLVVYVSDIYNNPVQNSTVTFTVFSDSGGRVSDTNTSGWLLQKTVLTNSSGYGQAYFSTDNVGGYKRVTAWISTGTTRAVTFDEVCITSGPQKIYIIWGNNKSGTVGSVLYTSFKVYVTDINDSATGSTPVTFERKTPSAYGNDDGRFTINSSPPADYIETINTNSSGYAEITYILDSKVCQNTIRAYFLNFIEYDTYLYAYGKSGPPAQINIISPSNGVVSDSKGIFLSNTPFIVEVTDTYGPNVVSGAIVSFVILHPTSAGSNPKLYPNNNYEDTREIVTSDINGRARIYLTLDDGLAYDPDTNYVSAVIVSGDSVGFMATGTVRYGISAVIDSIEIASGNNQIGIINQMLSNQLIVKVKDIYGNALAGAQVTFTLLSGGSLSSLFETTNSEGRAGVYFTFDSITGLYKIKAEIISGTTKEVIFEVTAIQTIVIISSPKITTENIPDGEDGLKYGAIVNASEGTPPYSWSITNGSLPDGYALNSASGEISGITPNIGDYGFTLQVMDNSGLKDSKQLLLRVINEDKLAPNVSSISIIPDPTVGAPFVQIKAKISDVGLGDRYITHAEYFEKEKGADGAGTKIDASDEKYDNKEEEVVKIISMEGKKIGLLKIYLHGKDSAGNWGELKEVKLRITSKDNNAKLTYAYPNVFSPTYPKVEFIFDNPQNEETTIKIFTVGGKLVKEIKQSPYEWDGKDASGEESECGLYIYQIIIGKTVKSGELVIAR